MTRSQRIRVSLVMQAARLMRVPVCLHQEFLSEQRPRESVPIEKVRECGRILHFAPRGVGAIRSIDD